MHWQETIAAFLTIIGGVIWAVRLEGKVALTAQQNAAIIDRLVRIEGLLDSLVKFNGDE
jgi:hypothetical protein